MAQPGGTRRWRAAGRAGFGWRWRHRRAAPRCWPRFRVVTYDQRGHGASAAASDAFLADLQAVLDTLAREHPLLVGHSLGGLLAVEHAATRLQQRHPQVKLARLACGHKVPLERPRELADLIGRLPHPRQLSCELPRRPARARYRQNSRDPR